MSDIKVNCPHCKQTLEVPEEMLGTIAECPSCNGQIQLPSPQSYTMPKPIVLHKTQKSVTPNGVASTESQQNATRSCPFCGEQILTVAIKCKHCGSALTSTKSEINKSEIGGIGWALILIPPVTVLLSLLFVPNVFVPRLIVSYSAVLFTTLLITFEAHKVGAGNSQDLKPNGSRREGPVLWFITGLLFWMVVYPWWMARRAQYGLRNLCALSIFIVVVFWFMSSLLFLGQQEKVMVTGTSSQQAAMPSSRESITLNAAEKAYVDRLIIEGSCFWLSNEQVLEKFKKIKQHFGDNSVFMMDNYVKIVEKIPHLTSKEDGEFNQEDLYNIMRAKKLNIYTSLKESGVFEK